jgi:hypothetical protein
MALNEVSEALYIIDSQYDEVIGELGCRLANTLTSKIH